jgi:hypothetical protein
LNWASTARSCTGFETKLSVTSRSHGLRRGLKEKADERQRRRIAELARLVARQALELDFFKGALLRIEENRRKQGQNSGKPSTSKSGTWTGSKAN